MNSTYDIIAAYRLRQDVLEAYLQTLFPNDVVEVADPICRYIFIFSATSRDPLDCSKEQLQHVLHHHKVMPSFLEHVFTFCDRPHAHTQSSFRFHDWLRPEGKASARKSLGRLEVQVQHCFNLVGLEYEENESGVWDYNVRQNAAYYSFDPSGGQSIWLLLKGNAAVRDRIKDAAQSQGTLSDNSTLEASFVSALRTHLIIFEWCVANWTPYLCSLEKKITAAAANANHAPVETLVGDPEIKRAFSRKSTMLSEMNQRQDSGLNLQFPGRVRSFVRQLGRQLPSGPSPSGQKTPAGPPQKKNKVSSVDFDKEFRFKELQTMHNLATQLQDASLILEQDKTVIKDIIKRFEDLAECEDFKDLVKIEKHHLYNFSNSAQHYVREIENQQSFLATIQSKLERHMALFNGILQYKNMRMGEYFAHQAKISTDNMETLTLKTKQETVSIHVITIMTLFFLPATFVSVRYGLPYLFDKGLTKHLQTFFSSNVIEFGDGPDDGDAGVNDGGDVGNWKTKWGALRLFGLVCGPLTGLVLLAWAAIYCTARHQRKSAASRAIDEEKLL
ncbi:hypothetical protein S40293_01224 [Stachybotrys chartarum IBT 40293]|nr:hypothetical protein S40293_01224 [Stachybotrys chartarum IBT 40293]